MVWRVLGNSLSVFEDQEESIDTEIRFEISSREGGRSELRFTHVGLVPEFECYEVCHKSWNFYIGHSPPKLITTGTGLPNEVADGIDVLSARVEAAVG